MPLGLGAGYPAADKPDIIPMHLGKLAKEVNNIGISATVNRRVSIPGVGFQGEVEIESVARGEGYRRGKRLSLLPQTALAVNHLMGMLDDRHKPVGNPIPNRRRDRAITLPAIRQTPYQRLRSPTN